MSTFTHVLRLMRFHQPIGILLLLWPTLWALCLASHGLPDLKILVIFVLGTIVMRAAGCIINDIADRRFDHQVARTQQRPLTTKTLPVSSAYLAFGMLCALALTLALQLNTFALLLSIPALLLAMIYPLMKRVTYFPQAILGLTFSFAILMAFAAVQNHLPITAWMLFAANTFWVVAYDTQYALVDKEDDIHIGIKSTAIFFGKWAPATIIGLQLCFLALFATVGILTERSTVFYFGLLAAGALFAYQALLVQQVSREKYFCAFINNHWVGAVIGIFLTLSY